MANRRDFLKGMGLLTLGGILKPEMAWAATTEVEKAKKALGLQIYSLGPELSGSNVAEGLGRLKNIGYSYIELAGYNGNGQIGKVSMADFKKMADDAGIAIKSSHMNPRLERGEKYGPKTVGKICDYWKKACEDHAVMKMPYIVQPGLPSIQSLEDAQRVAEIFNKAGEIAKSYGMQWGYHNHDREFAKVVAGGKEPNLSRNARDGRFIEEVFITETDADKVAIELDVYWTVMGLQDPVEWIDKYKDRIQVLHIKDRLVLGQSGLMNFEQIFKHFYANGHDTFFVEIEDTHSGKQFERVGQSAHYLMNAKFVK